MKDYLREMREKRLTKEAHQTDADKIRTVIHDKSLSKLEKLNKIQMETKKLELMSK